MANRNTISHSLPPRPPVSSHLSSSVPSTPQQRARRDFGSGSRSPSPNRLGGSHSPRSVVSEADGTMATLPRVGRPTCRFESYKAFSRRRIQYNIGDEPLGDPPIEPKKTLDPHEEKKLTGDMRELYDRLLPTPESEKRRRQFVEKLEGILHKEWPGTEFKVHVFGSSGNSLCTSDSDVDICIQTPMKSLESMHMLAAALANNGMDRVVCVAAAKVPIVKIWDPELQLASDMNVNNTLAIENTRMIKTYVQIDDRVRLLAMIIKHWTKRRILNDAGAGGTLSSYSWICMILHFLQKRNPPILPVLHQRPHQSYIANDGTESGFDDDLESIGDFGSKNKESVGQLLFHFFRYYGFEFNYDESVVSIRHQHTLSRKDKGWGAASKEGHLRLCIEEPFNATRNLGNSADLTAFRGIHLEIRSAFAHICELNLVKLCEEYVFPVEEKSIFKRPAPVAKPVLQSLPQNRKHAGGGMRSNRNNNQRAGGPSNRRSSSGATFGRGSLPYLSSPIPLPADFYTAESLNHQILQHWQMLGLRAEQLKAQLAYNQSQAQAQQVQSVAAAHAHSVVQGSTAASTTSSSSQRASLSQAQAASLANLPFYHNMNLFYPAAALEQSQQMSHSISQDGSRTNPSSPSISNAIPARRGMQRTSVSNGSQTSSIRSQSQPARGISQSMFMAYPVGYDASGLPLYAMAVPDMQSGYRNADLPSRQNGAPGLNAVESPPNEYLGYYLGEPRQRQSQMPPSSVDMNVPRIPSYSDLNQRRQRASHDLQPLALNANGKVSRSSSPGSHWRNISAALRSAPLPSGPKPRFNRADVSQAGDLSQSSSVSGSANPQNGTSGGGLLIVNGSSYSSGSIADGEFGFPAPVDRYSVASAEDMPSAFFEHRDSVFQDDNYSDAQYQQQLLHNELLVRHHAAEMLHSQMNGLSIQNMPVDSATLAASLGSPMQAFPAYVDPDFSLMSPLMSQEEESVMSPKTLHHSPWQSIQPHHTAVAPSESSPDAKEPLKSPGSRSTPVLSPVMETRTLAPSAHRTTDTLRPTALNGRLPNGVILNGLLPFRSEPVPPTPATNTVVYGPASPSSGVASVVISSTIPPNSSTPSQWQTPARKKNTRRRSKSGPTTRSGNAVAAPRPEPLPVRIEDRKGG